MARRSSRIYKRDNEVFDYRKLADLQTASRGVGLKIMSHMALALTPQEFIDAFIAPEHVVPLNTAMSLIGHVGDDSTNTTLYLPHAPYDTAHYIKVSVNFGMNRPPIILPPYVMEGLRDTCPDDVREKITRWVVDIAALASKLRDVQAALEYLNTRCGDTAAFTLCLPCLPELMTRAFGEDSREGKAAQKLREIKKFGALPSLSPVQRERLKDIAAVMQAVTLMDSERTVFRSAEAGIAVIGGSGVHDFSSENQHETVFIDADNIDF